MTPLKLYFCRTGDPARENFGDILSPILIERLFGRPVAFAPRSNCDMVAIGSILDRVARTSATRALSFRRMDPVHVWGAGFIRDRGNVWFHHLVVHALRGRQSAERLRGGRDAALGDPGLLAPLLMDVVPSEKRYAVAFVPHVDDLGDPRTHELVSGIRHAVVVNLHDDPLAVLDTIARSEVVLSTSLHGLVAADSLGIPNRWATMSDRVAGSGFKFADYFSGVGRAFEDALDLSRGVPDRIADAIVENWKPVDVPAIQKRLIEAFPFR